MTLLFIITHMVGAWLTYAKAGKPGWAALVPFYNTLVLGDIVGSRKLAVRLIWLSLAPLLLVLPMIFFVAGSTSAGLDGTRGGGAGLAAAATLLGIAMIVLFALMLICWYRISDGLARSFGQGTAFAIGVFVCPALFYLVIGFSDMKYRGPALSSEMPPMPPGPPSPEGAAA